MNFGPQQLDPKKRFSQQNFSGKIQRLSVTIVRIFSRMHTFDEKANAVSTIRFYRSLQYR